MTKRRRHAAHYSTQTDLAVRIPPKATQYSPAKLRERDKENPPLCGEGFECRMVSDVRDERYYKRYYFLNVTGRVK